MKKRDEEAALIPRQLPKETDGGWLSHVGWVGHLRDRSFKDLDDASCLPGKEEEELHVVARLVEETLDQCLSTLENTNKEIRQWWRSPKGQELHFRPLKAFKTRQAWMKAVHVWQRFVCYCLRGLQLPESQRKLQLNLTLSQEQIRLLSELLHGAQRACRGSGEVDKSNFDALLSLIQDFSISVLQQSIWGMGWENPLIHFTAVLGCNFYAKQFKPVIYYTTTLNAVIFCSRLFFLQHCTVESQRKESESQPGLFRDHEVDISTRTKIFMDCRMKYMTNGCFKPMSRMLGDLAYGLARAMQTGGPTSVHWTDREKEVLIISGLPVQVVAFKTMVHNILQEAEDLLWQDLMFTEEKEARFTIDLMKIIDDMSTTKLGSSFITDHRNHLGEGFQFILTQIQGSEKLRKLMLSGKSLNKAGVKQYRKQVKRFQEYLFMLIHITGGQPARGTEISSILRRDSMVSDRNIFVLGGQVCVITQYHKSMAITDQEKVIPRWLPAKVGQLTVIFLVYVQAFMDATNAVLKDQTICDWLWTHKSQPWETVKLSDIFGRETESRMGVRLTMRTYRHVAVAFSRDIVHQNQYSFEKEVQDQSEDELHEEEWAPSLQTGHSSKVRSQSYAVLPNVLRKVTSNSLDIFRGVSNAWHVWLGLVEDSESGRRAGKRRARSESVFTGLDNSEGMLELPRQAQAGPVLKRQRSRTLLRTVAEDFKDLNDWELDRAILKAMNDKFQHKDYKSPQQGEALRAVLRCQSPLIVVLPTGGGKSLLFMLPAILEPYGTTVVIVPFISLAQDLLNRCQEAKIDCVLWDSAISTR